MLETTRPLSVTYPSYLSIALIFNILMTVEFAITDLPLLGFCIEFLMGAKYAQEVNNF